MGLNNTKFKKLLFLQIIIFVLPTLNLFAVSPEDQDQNISNPSSSSVASSGSNKTKEEQSQKLSQPVQNVLPPPGSPSKLLTKPRPYKDEDLFSQLEKKMKKDFDQMEEQMEKEFDQMKKKMEKDFNSD